MFRNPFRKSAPGPEPVQPSPDKPAAPQDVPGPYLQSHLNFLYQLLFCDDPALFHPRAAEDAAAWQAALFAAEPDAVAIEALAANPETESRVRVLAYNWLRLHGHRDLPNTVLGVIVEVPLEQGLDVLAAYADGSVRYLNQAGKVAIVEDGVAAITDTAHAVVAAAAPVVALIGPWDGPRRPPPPPGNVRMTFLVADGLYFGEGPFDVMLHEPAAGPVMQLATTLLQQVVAVARD